MKQLPVAGPDSSGREHFVKRGRRALRKTENIALVPAEPPRDTPFLSFRYSWAEISSTGGTARVKAKHARYEDGRLTTEQFEGELDRGVCERALRDAQRRFFEQWGALLRSFSSLLP